MLDIRFLTTAKIKFKFQLPLLMHSKGLAVQSHCCKADTEDDYIKLKGELLQA